MLQRDDEELEDADEGYAEQVADLQKGLRFLLDLFVHMIEQDQREYRIDNVETPVNLACYPIETVPYDDILTILQNESFSVDENTNRRYIVLQDDRTGLHYEFTVLSENRDDYVTISMQPMAI